ncbi:hypothetical protein V1633_12720 [Plantactinospora sonchi]|uniref:Uncharacterized protein n=1 Tax=Plantactinospora sonchi TaxID=1544735 RepID=A0ABU7RS67_9ACTN
MQDVVLRHQPDPVPQLVVLGVQVASLVGDGASGRRTVSGQRGQQSRFARPARTHHGEQTALVECEADVVEQSSAPGHDHTEPVGVQGDPPGVDVLAQLVGVDDELVPAERQQVAGLQNGLVDPLPVDVRAVAGAEVDHAQAGRGAAQFRVVARHQQVGQDDVVVRGAADPGTRRRPVRRRRQPSRLEPPPGGGAVRRTREARSRARRGGRGGHRRRCRRERRRWCRREGRRGCRCRRGRRTQGEPWPVGTAEPDLHRPPQFQFGDPTGRRPRAVPAAQVAQPPPAGVVTQLQVLPGDPWVVDDDPAQRIPADPDDHLLRGDPPLAVRGADQQGRVGHAPPLGIRLAAVVASWIASDW